MTRLRMAAALLPAMCLWGHAEARAFGGEEPPASWTSNPDFAAGTAAIGAERYESAIAAFEKVVAAEPRNADAMTYLGYSHRKLGAFESSLAWYRKALAIEPEHRGATEYLGELYLQMDDLPRAEAQLARLEELCFFGCRELDELAKAIADHKAGRETHKTPKW